MQSKKYYQLMIPHAALLHSTKPELRFCAGSNPAPSVLGIRQKYLSKIGNKNSLEEMEGRSIKPTMKNSIKKQLESN